MIVQGWQTDHKTNVMFFPIFARFSFNLSKFDSNLVYSAHGIGLNVLSLVSFQKVPRFLPVWIVIDHCAAGIGRILS